MTTIEIDIARVFWNSRNRAVASLTTPTLTAATAASIGSRLMRSISRNLWIA